MKISDSTWLVGPLFLSVSSKAEDTKPGQIRATSRLEVYVGLREGVHGWMVIFATRPLQAAVVSNMTLDPVLRRRPLMLAQRDTYDPEGSSPPIQCKEWNMQIKRLFEMLGGWNKGPQLLPSLPSSSPTTYYISHRKIPPRLNTPFGFTTEDTPEPNARWCVFEAPHRDRVPTDHMHIQRIRCRTQARQVQTGRLEKQVWIQPC